MKAKICLARICFCIAVFAAALFGYFVFFATDAPNMILLTKNDGGTAVISESDGMETVGDGITPISVPKSAERGRQTAVVFNGTPGEQYQIRVFYASGLSESKSFLPVTADENGDFSWVWKVSANARAGDIRVIVTGGDCRVSFKIRIF